MYFTFIFIIKFYYIKRFPVNKYLIFDRFCTKNEHIEQTWCFLRYKKSTVAKRTVLIFGSNHHKQGAYTDHDTADDRFYGEFFVQEYEGQYERDHNRKLVYGHNL